MQINQRLSERKIFSRASRRQRAIAAVVFLTLAACFALLWLAGHYKFSLWPYSCGFRQRYNLPCPTCSMTTSARAFAQGRILESFYIQPAAGLLCSMLAVSAFLAFFVAVFGVYFRFLERFFAQVKIKYIILALIVIIACGWAVTLARALAAMQPG